MQDVPVTTQQTTQPSSEVSTSHAGTPRTETSPQTTEEQETTVSTEEPGTEQPESTTLNMPIYNSTIEFDNYHIISGFTISVLSGCVDDITEVQLIGVSSTTTQRVICKQVITTFSIQNCYLLKYSNV